jgi:hypothetical protein
MLEFSKVNADKPGFYQQVCDAITTSANSISIDQDIAAYVQENQTGVTVPPDIAYVPYDSDQPTIPTPKEVAPKQPAKGGKVGKYSVTSKSTGNKVIKYM